MRFLIIILAADQARANAASKAHFDSGAGEFTFTVPLFAADAETDDAPTHYWCSAEVSPENVPVLQAMQPAFPGSAVVSYDLANARGFPQEKLAEIGLRTSGTQLGADGLMAA